MPRPVRERHVPTRTTQRREELIERLIDVFLDEGFADTSIEDLAHALRCSKSTLYAVAASKEQIIVAVVRAFFRRSAERVEAAVADESLDPLDRLRAYLIAISHELAPASPAFFADLDSMPATQEIYRDNTRFAARKVQDFVRQAAPRTSTSTATFIGAVAAQVMEAIHRGEIETATGYDDSAAYRALADLIVAGMSSRMDSPTTHPDNP
ncbi:TetR/AcrR family transcriptional regulator [Microbacterium sp.]|uniref:TetR/AcrR family transcriptional regulator n=1 Tax=Microbacterium sp. TaxID=51671 RepID=UPI002BC36F90|nr:TetR/AcrR family transcriptional regulator [Microbacterium sp.]HWL79181.1 TetR/AcrR family transcriptional regulator [Microbacterium sp.]